VLAGTSWSEISGNKISPIYGAGDYWVLKLATREAPVGRPAVLVNSLYSPNSIYAVTNATFALVEMQRPSPADTSSTRRNGFGPYSNSVAYSGPVTFVSDASLRSSPTTPTSRLVEADL